MVTEREARPASGQADAKPGPPRDRLTRRARQEADDAGGEEEAEARGAGRLEELWAFDCELSRGRNVSCLAWNPAQVPLRPPLPVQACTG